MVKKRKKIVIVITTPQGRSIVGNYRTITEARISLRKKLENKSYKKLGYSNPRISTSFK